MGRGTRNKALVTRLAEFAELSELGWSDADIRWKLSVTQRTLLRYRKRLLRGEPPAPTQTERECWFGFSPHLRRQRATLRLRHALGLGQLVVGPDGSLVRYLPRSKYDSYAWVDESGRRLQGKQCRVLEGD